MLLNSLNPKFGTEKGYQLYTNFACCFVPDPYWGIAPGHHWRTFVPYAP